MALWAAGQARVAREQKARLAEHFTAARDAGMDVLVSSGQAKPIGAWQKPSYVRATAPATVRSPAARDHMLAKLGAMIPGLVVRSARNDN